VAEQLDLELAFVQCRLGTLAERLQLAIEPVEQLRHRRGPPTLK
jgi:hypothetical protein